MSQQNSFADNQQDQSNNIQPIQEEQPTKSMASEYGQNMKQKYSNQSINQNHRSNPMNKTQTTNNKNKNTSLDNSLARNTDDYRIKNAKFGSALSSPKKSVSQNVTNMTNMYNGGGGDKELKRAFSTYLNVTGPGEYTLPSLTVGKSYQSNRRNAPAFTMSNKTKLPYFPQTQKEFQGKDSPSSVLYSPEPNFVRQKDPNYKIGTFQRFHLCKEEVELKSQLPVSYSQEVIHKETNTYKQIGQGYGTKLSYKTGKEDETNPGPIYKNEYYQSIQHKIDKTQDKKGSTFGVDKEQHGKVTYAGQERCRLGTQSPGPGVYQNPDNIKQLSSVRNNSRYSIPKNDRGLLKMVKDEKPNPHTYNNTSDIFINRIAKKDAAFSMGQSERNFNFTKYNPLNRDIILKGLQ